LLVLLVTGLVTVAGYALVQSLQTSQQTIGKAVHQTAERILMLNISVDGVEFPPGSTIHLKATIGNAGTEEVLLEYFAGQLFEVIIRDESGTIVYVHSDRGGSPGPSAPDGERRGQESGCGPAAVGREGLSGPVPIVTALHVTSAFISASVPSLREALH